MYEYLKGLVTEISPTYIVVEVNGVGYFINISLYSFGLIGSKTEVKLFVHQVVREDAHVFYGFVQKSEREVFRNLISISGVGPNTARVMLSSLSPAEITDAIVSEDVKILKTIKGIGEKSAKRIVVELKDKLSKGVENIEIKNVEHNRNKDEALSALVMLGFMKNSVEKVLKKIVNESDNLSVEELVKRALKEL
ncbi:MAG: Holliday junction branch migration protein RuvA [Bacteroidales bacterium]|jgi:Holliday junction DNA helicase RuvA|nr:Holliday junction branch migration protein RuvA [Bacteroidales bacterium]